MKRLGTTVWLAAIAAWSGHALAQVETHTVFDNLHPSDVNLSIDCPPEYGGHGGPDEDYFCSYDKDGWSSGYVFPIPYYGEDWGELYLYPAGLGQETPWYKLRSYHYTASSCGSNTDLGDGWCKRTISNPTWFYGSGIDGYDFYGNPIPPLLAYIGAAREQVDNIVIDTISNNIEIDFDPWNAANTIRPKSTYLITIQVKTTSIADGDAYDFDASTVDPATLKVGPENAELAALPLSGDADGDGDTDITFGFQLADTGIDCLDDSIMIAGQTYSGDPLAGHDVIVPVECEEPLEIDLDPFNDPNIVRPNDNYNMTIAILGMRIADGDSINFFPEYDSSGFSLDRDTIRIGPAETTTFGSPIISDVNGDSHKDLLVNFNVFDAGIACGDTEIPLIGAMNNGLPVTAVDSIVTEDCDTGCHP